MYGTALWIFKKNIYILSFLHFYIVSFLFFHIVRFLHFWKEVCKCGVEWWWSLTSITIFKLFHFYLYISIFTFLHLNIFCAFGWLRRKCASVEWTWWWSLTSITGTIFPIGHNLPDSSVRLHFTIQPPSINNLTIPTIHLDLHPSILSPFSAVHFFAAKNI